MTDLLNERRLAVSIEFPATTGQTTTTQNPKIWFGSHSDINYPLNVVPLDAKLLVDDAISELSWNADFYNGTYSISSLEVKVVDKNGSLSNEIAQKLVNFIGTRHAVLRVYEFRRDQQVIDVGPLMNRFDSLNSNVVATYFIMDHYFDRGLVRLECKDIVRQMKNVLFEDKDLVLTQDFGENDTSLNVMPLDDDDFAPIDLCNFEHNFKYALHPGNTPQPANYGYLRIRDSDEIIAVEPVQPGFPGVLPVFERNLFSTVGANVPIDLNNDLRNGPQVENIVYIEEYAPEMFYMLLTGVNNSGPTPRQLPNNYHLGIEPKWINEYSIYGDNSNNGTADNLRLRVLRDEPVTNAKSWIEKQILLPMRSVMHVNRFGQIELVKMQAISEGSEQTVLDMRNINKISQLGHIKEYIHNPIVLEYDKSILDGKYKRVHGFNDASSVLINQNTELKRFQFETLYSAINTSAQIDKLRIAFQDFYGHEHQTLTVDVLPSLWRKHTQIGHRVRVKVPKVRDDAQKEGAVAKDIDRVFMVRGVKRNIMTCGLQLELISTQERATDFSRTLSEFEIPKDKYPVDKLPLNEMPGFDTSIIPSTLPNGDIEYFINATLTIPGGRYYFLGDLTINGDINVVRTAGGTGDFELWTCGNLNVNGTIDTVGQGAHRPGDGQQTVTVLPNENWVDELKEPEMIAEGGYFGTPNTVGGIYHDQHDLRMVGIPPLDEVTGEVEEVPELHLSNECGCLRGIPPTVSGTPSSGSMGSVYESQTVTTNPNNPGVITSRNDRLAVTSGLDGVHGGGGVVLVSRGGSFGPQGLIRTNGQAAVAPVVSNTDPVTQASRMVQVNSGGMPGAFIWLTDGGVHNPPFSDQDIEDHFDAYAGYPGTDPYMVMPHSDYHYNRIPASPYYSFYEPTDHTINRAIAASRHQYVPQNQKLDESQDTHWLDDEAALNPDNQVYLWSSKDGNGFGSLVNGVPPVPNPVPRDLYIDDANLNSGLPQSQIIMWRYEAGVWNQITGFDSTASFMLDLCRRLGTSTLHFGPTRPISYQICDAWFNEDTDKTVKLGATAAADTIIYTRQYGDLGDDVLEDGNFLYHDVCEITWQTDTNRFGGPNIYPGSFPKYPEQIVGGSAFGRTIGENATPGWQLDAQGTGSYICLRPRRPIKIHPGEKYVVESIIRTTGFAIGNPAAEGYTIFATVFDINGNLLWNNGTDTALGEEYFQSGPTVNLTQSGWHLVHNVFTIPETITDARYLVPNAMVHALLGSVVISQMHVRRIREQIIRDVTPAPFTLGFGLYRQPGNFPSNSQFDMEIPQGSRFNFSIVGTFIGNLDFQYTAKLYLMRGGIVRKSYFWETWVQAGTRESMDVDFDYLAEEYYDGFAWDFAFAGASSTGLSVQITSDLAWAFKQFTQVESGATNQ